MAIKRTRNFATVIYLDSAPVNWLDILSGSLVPSFISPLHTDSDKEHFHVLVMFDSVKTPDQARELFQSFGGVGCEAVNSLRAYARYLCHLDERDKPKYDISDVVSLGGADYHKVITLPADRYSAISEMMDYVYDHNVISYAALMRYARDNQPDWFRSLCDSSSMVMREYIKSLAWERSSE